MASTSQQHVHNFNFRLLLSNHNELMANFFAQPNALALGKEKEGYSNGVGGEIDLSVHKGFDGDRPR